MGKIIKIPLMCTFLFVIGIFLSACGGGKSTPPTYPIIPIIPTPTPVAPEIQLSNTLFEINIGDTDNITVTLDGENVTEEAIYTPDDENIATVEKGLITAHNQGTTIVNVHVEGAKEDKTFIVNVIDPELPTLKLSQNVFVLKVGQTDNITVTLEDKDVTEDVNYRPANEAIATVEKGIITALSKGATDVIVSLENANNAIFTVNVDLTDLQLSKSEFELNIDEKAEIEVTCNCKILTKDVTYTVNKTTEDENIVTVEEGIIKSQYQGGETTVTVSLKGISNDATFTVKVKDDSVGDVELNKTVYTALYDLGLVTESYDNRKKLTEINIPGTYKDNDGNKHKITSIGEYIFKDSKLKTVTIPNSIITINGYAFESCKDLTEINIPDSVQTLGTKVFKDSGVKTVNIGTGLITIGKYAFASSAVTTINISESNKVLTTIEEYAFDSCDALTEIVLPNNVAERTKEEGMTGIEIKKYAFSECSSLKELVIPDTVTELGKYVCSNCTSLETLELGNGITEIKEEQFSNKNNLDKLVTVTIGTGVKTIEKKAFADSKITKIIIPDNVETIGIEAFTACVNLTTVEIGKGVKTIGTNAFSGCGYYQSAAHLKLTIPDQVETIGANAFSKVQCIYYTQNLTAEGSPWGAESYQIIEN